MTESFRVFADFFDGMAARAPDDDRDAGEDQGGGDPHSGVPFLVEDQGREREADERLKININGDGARLDAGERPGIQVVSTDCRHKNDIDHGEPDAPSDFAHGSA